MHALTVAADLVSGLSRQSRGSGQFALVGVEGKKLGGTEVQCRSHVQHVDGAMSGTSGVLCDVAFPIVYEHTPTMFG